MEVDADPMDTDPQHWNWVIYAVSSNRYEYWRLKNADTNNANDDPILDTSIEKMKINAVIKEKHIQYISIMPLYKPMFIFIDLIPLRRAGSFPWWSAAARSHSK